MAINFLTCEAKAVMKLVLTLNFQNGKDITHKEIMVDTGNPYKITYANGTSGITTVNGRIISFTLGTTKEVLSYVSQDTKPTAVDTITVDCSEEGSSSVKILNICDIRDIEELAEFGFEEIERKDIPTFK